MPVALQHSMDRCHITKAIAFLSILLVFNLLSIPVNGLQCACSETSSLGPASDLVCDGVEPASCEGPDADMVCVTSELLHKQFPGPIFTRKSCLHRESVALGCSFHQVSGNNAAVMYLYACDTDYCNDVSYDDWCVRMQGPGSPFAPTTPGPPKKKNSTGDDGETSTSRTDLKKDANKPMKGIVISIERYGTNQSMGPSVDTSNSKQSPRVSSGRSHPSSVGSATGRPSPPLESPFLVVPLTSTLSPASSPLDADVLADSDNPGVARGKFSTPKPSYVATTIFDYAGMDNIEYYPEEDYDSDVFIDGSMYLPDRELGATAVTPGGKATISAPTLKPTAVATKEAIKPPATKLKTPDAKPPRTVKSGEFTFIKNRLAITKTIQEEDPSDQPTRKKSNVDPQYGVKGTATLETMNILSNKKDSSFTTIRSESQDLSSGAYYTSRKGTSDVGTQIGNARSRGPPPSRTMKSNTTSLHSPSNKIDTSQSGASLKSTLRPTPNLANRAGLPSTDKEASRSSADAQSPPKSKGVKIYKKVKTNQNQKSKTDQNKHDVFSVIRRGGGASEDTTHRKSNITGKPPPVRQAANRAKGTGHGSVKTPSGDKNIIHLLSEREKSQASSSGTKTDKAPGETGKQPKSNSEESSSRKSIKIGGSRYHGSPIKPPSEPAQSKTVSSDNSGSGTQSAKSGPKRLGVRLGGHSKSGSTTDSKVVGAGIKVEDAKDLQAGRVNSQTPAADSRAPVSCFMAHLFTTLTLYLGLCITSSLVLL